MTGTLAATIGVHEVSANARGAPKRFVGQGVLQNAHPRTHRSMGKLGIGDLEMEKSTCTRGGTLDSLADVDPRLWACAPPARAWQGPKISPCLQAASESRLFHRLGEWYFQARQLSMAGFSPSVQRTWLRTTRPAAYPIRPRTPRDSRERCLPRAA